tara:strand:+ start:97 stop:465 length:369 start_codon:yes stop_codon:yes gene_type:complete
MKIDNISQERFEKAKKKIIKKYPGAHTVMDPNGQYYVATAEGRDICNIQVGQAINAYEFNDDSDLYGFNATLNKITMIPHSDSVKAAWMTTEVAIKSYHVVDRNSSKFSDDKVMKKMAKDFE